MIFDLLFNRYVIGAGVVILLMFGAYEKGRMVEAVKCHDAELRARIESLTRDLTNAKSAAHDAATRSNQLEQSNSESNMKVAAYERELAKRKGDTCDINPADLRGMRKLPGERR